MGPKAAGLGAEAAVSAMLLSLSLIEAASCNDVALSFVHPYAKLSKRVAGTPGY